MIVVTRDDDDCVDLMMMMILVYKVIVKEKYDGMMIFTNVHIYMFDPCFAVKGTFWWCHNVLFVFEKKISPLYLFF